MQRYFAVILFLSNGFSLFSQATGTLTGTVVLDAKGTPLHHATIIMAVDFKVLAVITSQPIFGTTTPAPGRLRGLLGRF